MTLKLHCWGRDGRIAEIDIAALVIEDLKQKCRLDIQIIPDSSFYTAKLPYLESEEGPITDLALIFEAVVPLRDAQTAKERVVARSMLAQTVMQMERAMLYVLYEEQYAKTRRIHAGLNRWPLAYYPPMWMRRWSERRCGDLIEPDAEDDGDDVPIIHDIQRKDADKKRDMRVMRGTLRCNAVLDTYGHLSEVAKLFVHRIEQYRAV